MTNIHVQYPINLYAISMIFNEFVWNLIVVALSFVVAVLGFVFVGLSFVLLVLCFVLVILVLVLFIVVLFSLLMLFWLLRLYFILEIVLVSSIYPKQLLHFQVFLCVGAPKRFSRGTVRGREPSVHSPVVLIV